MCVPFPKCFQLSPNTRDYSALQHALDTLPPLPELSQTPTTLKAQNLTSQQRALLEWTLASHPRRKASAFQPISLLTFLNEVPSARLTGSHASNPSLLPHAVFKLERHAQANVAVQCDHRNAVDNNFEGPEGSQEQQQHTVIAFQDRKSVV